MPLVRNGHIATDIYFYAADGTELPGDGPVLVSAARFLEDPEALLKQRSKVGVVWPNNRNVDDLVPYLELSMRLGEGTGAALFVHLARAAALVYRDMATFKMTPAIHNRMPTNPRIMPIIVIGLPSGSISPLFILPRSCTPMIAAATAQMPTSEPLTRIRACETA